MPRFLRPVVPQQQRGNLRPAPVNPTVVAPVAGTVLPTYIRQVTVQPRLTSHTILAAPTVRPSTRTIVHTVVAPPPAVARRHGTVVPPGRRT
jgi:hypothetical protein